MAKSNGQYDVSSFQVTFIDVILAGPVSIVDITTVMVDVYTLEAANDNREDMRPPVAEAACDEGIEDEDFYLDLGAVTLHTEPIPESNPDHDFVMPDLSKAGNAAYVHNGRVYNTLAADDGNDLPFGHPLEDGSPEAPFTLELIEDGSPERPFTLEPDTGKTGVAQRKNRGTPEDCDVILVPDGKGGVTTAVRPDLAS